MVKYLDNNASGFRQFSEMKEKNAPKFGFFTWILLFLIVYWLFLPQKKVDGPQQQTPEIERVDVSKVPRHLLSNTKISATIQGFRISDIELADYKENRKSDKKIRLLSGENEFIEIGFLANGATVPMADTKPAESESSTSFESRMRWKSDGGVEIKRGVALPFGSEYIIAVTDEVKNIGKTPVFVSQYARVVQSRGESSQFAIKTGGIAYINGKIETELWDDIEKRPLIYQSDGSQSDFVGFSDQYWQAIVATSEPSSKVIKLKKRADKMFQAEIAPELAQISAGKTATFTTFVFAGPKTQGALLNAGKNIAGIDRTLDYGWFGFLSRPFLWTLNWLYDIIPSYGIAIILLTLIIRAMMWPLTRKSFKGMAAMQKIQPEMRRIQELYADDKMRMQQEILRLYRTHKANPLSSIGMMFLQIPIFFALYKALLIAVPLRHASFLWLTDLSARDPYFILPIIMGLTMYIQNKINGAGQNPDMPGAKVMKYMPFAFTVLFAWMPSGLVLYWTVSNIVGIIQLKLMKKGENK